jgi:hypothetical protein
MVTCSRFAGPIFAGKFKVLVGCLIESVDGEDHDQIRVFGSVAFILLQAEEGTAVDVVCCKAGIGEATYYNWRTKYVGCRR